jgi:hypothetical protein
MKTTRVILLAASVVLAASLFAPLRAEPRSNVVCRPTYPGLIIEKYHYRAPDGTYYSYSGYVRDVNGIPCGLECGPPEAHQILLASPPGFECVRAR